MPTSNLCKVFAPTVSGATTNLSGSASGGIIGDLIDHFYDIFNFDEDYIFVD